MGVQEEFLKISLQDMGQEIEDVVFELNEAVEAIHSGNSEKAVVLIETARSRLANLCLRDCYYCWKDCDIDECSDCNTCPRLFYCISKDKIDFSRKI